jgi:hypothetical protein
MAGAPSSGRGGRVGYPSGLRRGTPRVPGSSGQPLRRGFMGNGALPRLIQYATKADTDAVLDAFGKNEQVKKIFWTFFIAIAGLVLAQVVDPAAAAKIVETLAGIIP